jgi:FkbM family methyltransferase
MGGAAGQALLAELHQSSGTLSAWILARMDGAPSAASAGLTLSSVNTRIDAREGILVAVKRAGLTLLRAQKLVRLLPHRSYRAALRQGVVASVEHQSVPFESDFRTVLDVGANTGQFALFALHRFPQARVYSLEPLGSALDKLREVTSTRVTVLPYAASSAAGEATLHITAENDSSSLLQPAEDEVVADAQIVTRRLDELVTDLERPVLLKIDVQGYELEVLRGSERLLGSIDQILVECSFRQLYAGQSLADEVICHLRDRFRLEGVFGIAYDRQGRALQADLLFTCR